MKTLVLVLIGAAVLSGCATMAGMRTEPLDMGVTKVYETDLRAAVRSTRNALLGSALEIDDVEELDASTWIPRQAQVGAVDFRGVGACHR